VKPYLKIAGALALIAIVGFWMVAAHSESKVAACGPITLTGDMNPDTFLSMKDCLADPSVTDKTFIVTYSGGGDWESSLAIGILIHRHGWNVEVVEMCASSCANFIFPAGKVKYLHSNAMLLFHGGPHQENLLEQAIATEQAEMARRAASTSSGTAPATPVAPAEAKDPDRSRMEGHAAIDDKGPQRLKVREFLEVRDVTDTTDLFTKLRNVSDRFYAELGVNLLLPDYGQRGRYEARYQAYKIGGFMYRLDSLRKLGVDNIELKGGEWRPERNRDYPDVYEVTYP